MVSISIQNLTKRFGTTVALASVGLEILPGELFFLLGPSGCGKTTLLRTLAGFTEPDAGKILFGSEEVTRTPAHLRKTGMVFQNYALWPHLTVERNVAFGLEEQRVPKAEITKRVGEALESVRMQEYARRKIHQLSGGQQQRVALARALVVRPRCLLLDEPLSNLDARLRLEMRTEIRRICKESNLTAVYVTHDQKEALSISDRMALMEQGRVVQVGAPAEVYRSPATREVADFIGETNFIPGTITGARHGMPEVETGLGVFLGRPASDRVPAETGTQVLLSIRPESWRFDPPPQTPNRIHGRIVETVYLGEVAQYRLQTPSQILKVFELNPRDAGRAATLDLQLAASPEDVVILPAS